MTVSVSLIYVHMYIYVRACVHVCIYAHVCVHMCVCACIRPCMFDIMTGCWSVPDPHDHLPDRDTQGQYQCVRAVLHFGVPGYTDLGLITLALVAQRLKRLPGMRETQVRSLDQKDPLEEEMATHSSALAWRIPWREEPGKLQSMGSQRVGHD